ncbi:MAG: DNA translocase FtsK 4TM domain-containing protein, partial [Deltaproteobacteria bacterium]|nr:DNA translocase FtsK 4TM domain-containing protein [Deltaproteobacteria bacterium]
MRKEAHAILFAFLVLFTAGSLITYNPADISPFTAADADQVSNLFGVLGAHVAGFLIGVFGLGAWFLPVLLGMVGWGLLRGRPPRRMGLSAGGGFFFMLFSGAFAAVFAHEATLAGRAWSTGGAAGIGLARLLSTYLNPTGAGIVLFTFFLLSFMFATGVSLRRAGKALFAWQKKALEFAAARWRLYKSRRKKARIRAERTVRQAAGGPRTPPKIKKAPPKKPIQPKAKQKSFEFMGDSAEEGGFALPSLSLLDDPPDRPAGVDRENLQAQARLLEKKLADYGIQGKVDEVSPGPVITTFEYAPAPGVKISRITGLADDLSMALRATSVRIVGPIPGKAVVGIEVPNWDRELVCFKEVVGADVFVESKSLLTLCLGKDIVGNPKVADLAKMPHLLIAGATGAGKSVALNAMIASVLYKASPEQVRFIMVDPKRIELSLYDGIPHLVCPVVTDVKKATNALYWAVREMERRYELLASAGVRNLAQYNQKVEKAVKAAEKKKKEAAAAARKPAEAPREAVAAADSQPAPPPGPEEDPPEKLPFIVIIIDELA